MTLLFDWCKGAPGTRWDAHHDQCRGRIGDAVCGCPGHGESSSLVGESAPNERDFQGSGWDNKSGPEGALTPESPALTTLRILETERG